MRFMMLMVPGAYADPAPFKMPSDDDIKVMLKYNEELKKAGVLLALEGLHPPEEAARVTFKGGSPKVIDGPFAEVKEFVGGYWMLDVRSREEAIEWAKRCPAFENDTIELRQVQEMGEFSEDIQKAAKAFSEL